MGSVLAVGLIFGMMLTLIIVPVMYSIVMKPGKKKLPQRQKSLAHKAMPLSIVFILLSVTPTAYCSERTIITLSRAIDIAIMNNSSLLEADYNKQSAAEKINLAKANMLPTASANLAYTRLKKDPVMKIGLPPGPGAAPGKTPVQIAHSDAFHWNLTLVQPLFTGFALRTQYEMTQLELEIKNQEKEQVILDLTQQVKETYFNILFSKKILLIAEDAVTSLKSHEKDAQKLFDQGMIKYNDLLRAKVALANAVQNREKARSGVKMALSCFNILLDYEIEKRTEIEDISNITRLDHTLLSLTKMAMKQRPVFKVLNLGLKNLEKLIALEKSAYYPEVALIGCYERQGDNFVASHNDFSNEYNAAISLEASWVFFDSGKTKSKISAINKDKKALLSKIKNIEDQVKLEIKNAFLNLGVADKNIATSRQSLVQARENWRISNLQYRQQVATSSEVLDARTFLTQADTNYYNALYGYMIFLSKLERSVGRKNLL